MCQHRYALLLFAGLLSRHCDSSSALPHVLQVQRVAAAVLMPLILLAAPLLCSTRPMSASQAFVLETQPTSRQLLQIASVTGVVVPANTCTFPSDSGEIFVRCDLGYNDACCSGNGNSDQCNTDALPSTCSGDFPSVACCPAPAGV